MVEFRKNRLQTAITKEFEEAKVAENNNNLLLAIQYYERAEKLTHFPIDNEFKITILGLIKKAKAYCYGIVSLEIGDYNSACNSFIEALKYATEEEQITLNFLKSNTKVLLYLTRGIEKERIIDAMPNFIEANEAAKDLTLIQQEPSSLLASKELLSLTELILSLSKGIDELEKIYFEEANQKLEEARGWIPNLYYPLKLVCRIMTTDNETEKEKLIEKAINTIDSLNLATIKKDRFLLPVIYKLITVFSLDDDLIKKANKKAKNSILESKNLMENNKKQLQEKAPVLGELPRDYSTGTMKWGWRGPVYDVYNLYPLFCPRCEGDYLRIDSKWGSMDSLYRSPYYQLFHCQNCSYNFVVEDKI